MTTDVKNYDGSAIQVLEGLEAVRKRPGMYIGSTDKNGLHHLVYEIFDNSVDEVLNGHGDVIEVSILKGNGIRVRDFGRGMPVDMHEMGKSTPEVLFTVLHAGGKFGQGGYKTTGGLHGVGASVVNALSSSLEATIKRDGKVHNIKFENGGHTVQELTVVGKCPKKETGTEVVFFPDGEIFSTLEYSFETLADRLRETAFLNKSVKIILRDERKEEVRETEFFYEGGIADFVDYLNTDKTRVSPIEYLEGVAEETGVEIEIGFQWNDTYSENILSFVNNVRTKDGGTHETGFKTAITKALNEVAREKNLLKKNDKNLEGSDVREGFVGIVSVRVPEEILEFEGQTKSKLGTNVVRSNVEQFFFERVKHFLLTNPKVSDFIINKAIKAQQVREEAKKARDKARDKTTKRTKDLLSGKLTDATSKKRELCELFLVEGDSAGGSAKKARDRELQAILSLRGKVLNTQGFTPSKLAERNNQEINTIKHAIGTGDGHEFSIEDSRYGKIIIMTDADVDGSHIQVLLITYFKTFMYPLIENGYLYIAVPPLYAVTTKVKNKNVTKYAWTDLERDRIIKNLKGAKYELTRFKGLGEMNDTQLWETTMNPENRKLIKVEINNTVEADKIFETLMGANSEERKIWIEENVNFDSLEE